MGGAGKRLGQAGARRLSASAGTLPTFATDAEIGRMIWATGPRTRPATQVKAKPARRKSGKQGQKAQSARQPE
jgi:hypothetical protein